MSLPQQVDLFLRLAGMQATLLFAGYFQVCSTQMSMNFLSFWVYRFSTRARSANATLS